MLKKKSVAGRDKIVLQGEKILRHNTATKEYGVSLLAQKVLHYKINEKSTVNITYYDDETKKISIKAPDKGTEKILYEYFS